MGDDDRARAVRAALAAEPNIEATLVIDRSRPTTRKVRFVAGERGQPTHMFRADWGVAKPVAGKIEDAVIRHAAVALYASGEYRLA
jgi:D-beta-D-heptose 7-phosphate kinase/D-beta-D-heptose 1-phosphate adenosyltransferase